MRAVLSRSRVRLSVGAAALLVLLAVAAALASGAPRAHTARPALVLKARHPVTVRGTGFRPLRHVKVTLFAPQRVVHHPLANRQGTFTTTFSTVIDRCSGWEISASQPGRAPVMLHGPKPLCAPASTP